MPMLSQKLDSVIRQQTQELAARAGWWGGPEMASQLDAGHAYSDHACVVTADTAEARLSSLVDQRMAAHTEAATNLERRISATVDQRVQLQQIR